MLYDFFTDLMETGNLCQVWNIPVHIVVHFDIFDNDIFVSLQAAIEIVQVVYAGEFAGRGIE